MGWLFVAALIAFWIALGVSAFRILDAQGKERGYSRRRVWWRFVICLLVPGGIIYVALVARRARRESLAQTP